MNPDTADTTTGPEVLPQPHPTALNVNPDTSDTTPGSEVLSQAAECTAGLSALDHANSKSSTGYDTTGGHICSCGRHEFKLIEKDGVGDLQKGEKCVIY